MRSEVAGGGVGEVSEGFDAILFLLLVEHVSVSADGVKAGALLGFGLLGEEFVAGDGLFDEAVVGLVVVEALHHVVAVAPGVEEVRILLKAGRVAVAGEIEPVLAPLFAVAGRGEQLVDQLRVCIGAAVGEEGLDFVVRGRKAMQVEGGAADERRFVGGGGAFEALLLQLGVDEVVNIGAGGADRRLEGPPDGSFGSGRAVAGEDGTGGEPGGKQLLLIGGELAGGGHFHFAGVADGAEDTVTVRGEVSRGGEANPGHLHLLVVTLLAFGGEHGDGVGVRISESEGGGSEKPSEKAHVELWEITS